MPSNVMDSAGFARLGYGIEPNMLADSECERLISGLENSLVTRGRAGTRHLMANAMVAALANEDRLLAIARMALGRSAVPFRATLFAKTGEANWLIAWHQDTALPLSARFDATGWGPWSQKAGVLHAHAPASALSRIVALRVHLDASTARNGPLRVIPGSHSLGVLSDLQVLEYAGTHEQHDCLTPRGGIIAMRPLIVHASSKAQTAEPRRVLHIEYADTLDLSLGIRLAIT